eukprot:3671297-Pyramimonas_sp.AAC.1
MTRIYRPLLVKNASCDRGTTISPRRMADMIFQAQRNETWPTTEAIHFIQQHHSQAPPPLPTHQT